LPVKSLMRFKCVSKLWSSLIRSRYFSNLYLKVASSPSRLMRPLGVYMSLNLSLTSDGHYNCDSMEFCRNTEKFELLSLRLSLSSSNSDESSLEQDLTFPGMGGYNMVSLRGLILYTVCRKACIYNPSTRQSLTLPAVKSNIFAQQERNKHVFYFFGHDHVHDQYKIVCNVVVISRDYKKIITNEFWVFVLEPRGFWKRIEYDDQPHLPTKQGLCINGVIYYLASNPTCHVYCFDVRSEEFRVIQAPHSEYQHCKSLGFIEHGGKPAIFDCTRIRETGVFELWVLEVDGGTWSRKSLVLKPCQMHLVDDINRKKLIVHGTDQNNKVILALTRPCYILYYDLIKNDLRKVNIIRATRPYEPHDVCFKVMDKCENIMQLET
ncbi:putative F-box protein At5g62660, partial [Raphanus sativus]|uniref:F-box protein At5g62660 n=1 Tax=Raphanus sativus TaxID=3726 RepID=A0A9W3CSL8_RAPSA